MEIITGKKSGFCYGVKNAIDKCIDELEKTNETLYCLGELVHNNTVTKELENKGLVFVEDIKQSKGKTIIRAHGVPKEIYEEAKREKIELLDLTCPNVLKIHTIVQEYVRKKYYIFLIGKKEHPETIGTYSFCGKNSTIISKVEEVDEAIKEIKKSQLGKLLIISQTTYSLKSFNDIVKKVQEEIAENIKIEVKNTICLATEQRQKETEKISKEVDLMIIVGGKHSSNTSKLYEISFKNCKNVIFAETKEDIDISKMSKFQKIGIMAGASTPVKIVDDIIQIIQNSEIFV